MTGRRNPSSSTGWFIVAILASFAIGWFGLQQLRPATVDTSYAQARSNLQASFAELEQDNVDFYCMRYVDETDSYDKAEVAAVMIAVGYAGDYDASDEAQMTAVANATIDHMEEVCE